MRKGGCGMAPHRTTKSAIFIWQGRTVPPDQPLSRVVVSAVKGAKGNDHVLLFLIAVLAGHSLNAYDVISFFPVTIRNGAGILFASPFDRNV